MRGKGGDWRVDAECHVDYVIDGIGQSMAARSSRSKSGGKSENKKLPVKAGSGKRIHVIPQNDKWAVKSEGSSKAASVLPKKDAAISRAKQIAKRSSKDVVVHRKDGTIERWHKK
jgi:hypothetical protein